METENALLLPRTGSGSRIGFFGVFASPVTEQAFRQRYFREDLWLRAFCVVAGSVRVLVILVLDSLYYGFSEPSFALLACRLVFFLASALILEALCRAVTAVVADRLFFGWSLLYGGITVCSLASRPQGETALVLMSFSLILLAYCLAPLSLPSQLFLGLGYSVAALYACRHADSGTFMTLAVAYAISNLTGGIVSWRLNHRRRQMYLGALREAELRAGLETALAEIKTLRGLLCMCAWCKRIRDESESWRPVEDYVRRRTHATFTHAICPECMRAQVEALAPSGR